MKNLLTYGRAQELEERELELELLELLLLLLLPNLVMLTDSKKIVSRVFLKFKMKKCDLEFNSSPPCFQLIRKDQKESKKDPEFHFKFSQFQFQAAPAAGPSDPRLRLLASKFEVYSPQTGFSHVILIPMMPNMADMGGGREV